MDNHPIIKPKAISDRRSFQIDNQESEQVLVQWEDTPPEEATWENVADLEYTVIFKDGGNDHIKRAHW